MSDVLLIKTSSLGDVIHQMPAVTEARLRRPDARLTLFEARAKRAAFLRTAARELGVQTVAVAGRFEPGGWTADRFDIAISPAWQRDRLKVVAFVQERNSRHVLGAAVAPLAHVQQ